MKRILLFATTLLLTMVAQAANELVTLPAGVEAEDYTLAITHAVSQMDGKTIDNDKKMTVKVAFNGTDVYVQGLAYWFPESFIKGTLDGDKVTFPYGQFVGEDMQGAEYLIGYIRGEGGVEIANMELLYDAETRTLTNNPNVIIAEVGEPDEGNFPIYTYVKTAQFTVGGLPPLMPVEVPEELETDSYLLIAILTSYEQNEVGELEIVTSPYQIPVKVGFSGNDLYIQGLVAEIANGWVKATKNAAGKYVVPKGQYIGTQKIFNLTYDYFLSATSRTGGLNNVVFSYDGESGTLTSTQTIAFTGTEDKADAYYTFNSVKIKKVEEREATPSAPQFTPHKGLSYTGLSTEYYADIFIALTDTEENPMLADKVSFMFYKDKDNVESPVTFLSDLHYNLDEDLTEMPFNVNIMPDFTNHRVFFEKLGENELMTWRRLGLQTIYRGMGVEHRSEITWVDLTDAWGTGIADIRVTEGADTYFDLQGRKTDASSKGMVIRRIVKADGTVQTVKYMNR